MLISKATDLFCEDYLWANGFSIKTEKNYRWAMDSFIKIVGDIPIGSLTVGHIKQWRKQVEARHWERNSVNAYMYKYRSLARWWNKRHLIKFDPDDIIIPKKRKNLPKYLTREELIALITVAEIREKAIISLLYSSAMRVGEIVQVRKKDVSDTSITIRGKGDCERVVLIDSLTRKLLADYFHTRTDTSPFLFYTRRHGGISISSIQKMLRQLGETAGIRQPVTPHLIRHSAATHWMSDGMGIRYIQELLGHADISTTQIYTHVVKTDLTKEYIKFHHPLLT